MPNDDDLIDLAEIDDVPPTKQLAAIAITLLLFVLLVGGMLNGCAPSGVDCTEAGYQQAVMAGTTPEARGDAAIEHWVACLP